MAAINWKRTAEAYARRCTELGLVRIPSGESSEVLEASARKVYEAPGVPQRSFYAPNVYGIASARTLCTVRWREPHAYMETWALAWVLELLRAMRAAWMNVHGAARPPHDDFALVLRWCVASEDFREAAFTTLRIGGWNAFGVLCAQQARALSGRVAHLKPGRGSFNNPALPFEKYLIDAGPLS